MLRNIHEYGLTGIGLGIPSDLDSLLWVIYLSLLNLSISLPTEKGIFYVAIYEELGYLFGNDRGANNSFIYF